MSGKCSCLRTSDFTLGQSVRICYMRRSFSDLVGCTGTVVWVHESVVSVRLSTNGFVYAFEPQHLRVIA